MNDAADKIKTKKDLLSLSGTVDTDDFMHALSMILPCAADVWMDHDDQEKLHEMFKSGKISDVESGMDPDHVRAMVKKGWKLFREEYNYDNYDAVLIKKKRK